MHPAPVPVFVPQVSLADFSPFYDHSLRKFNSMSGRGIDAELDVVLRHVYQHTSPEVKVLSYQQTQHMISDVHGATFCAYKVLTQSNISGQQTIYVVIRRNNGEKHWSIAGYSKRLVSPFGVSEEDMYWL